MGCQFTVKVVLPAILASLADLEQLSLEKAEYEARSMYSVLDAKLFDAYRELKCEPIIAIIEPNMYTGKFDWAKCVRPTGTRNYVKEILHNVVCVHAEVIRIGEEFVTRVMIRLVEAICEEVNRLYCCIQRMNSNGCVQAWVDIKCIEASLKPYMNKTSEGFVAEARKPLLVLEKDKDIELVESCLTQFRSHMKRHILCLQFKS